RPRPWACRAAPCTAACSGTACRTAGGSALPSMKPARRRRLTHTRRVLLLALGAVVPAAAAAMALAFTVPLSRGLRITMAAGIVLLTWGMLAALREAVVRPLQTLGNLTGALREEDFSFRARTDGSQDALNLA